ncbi:MAG: hypothetical protein ACI8XD_001756, partial [Thermoproteota archaeon]
SADDFYGGNHHRSTAAQGAGQRDSQYWQSN